MLQELTRMTMHMRDQRFNSTHASAKAVPLERLHTSLGAGVVKGQGDQYWLRPQFQCDIDEEIWKDSQEEKTFLWNHFHISSSMTISSSMIPERFLFLLTIFPYLFINVALKLRAEPVLISLPFYHARSQSRVKFHKAVLSSSR